MKSRSMLVAAVALASASLSAEGVRVRHYSCPEEGGNVAVRPIVSTQRMSAANGFSVVGISLFPKCAWPLDDAAVYGLRLDLLIGRHHDVYGLDIGGIANFTDCNEVGVEVGGLFNYAGWSDGAVMVGGAFNYVKHEFSGVQLALGYNNAEVECTGMQAASFNNTARLTGLQVGVFNRAVYGSGLQIGVVNCSESLVGLQIGVINMIGQSSVPLLPVFNLAF